MTAGTLRGALGLLTRLPVATAETDEPGAAAFGLVGAAVGLVGAIPLVLLGGRGGEPTVAAIAALAAMTVVTGALHLDGLADTADALLAGDPAAAERARRDPHLGTGGVIALILVIAAEVSALSSLVGSGGSVVAAAALVVAITVSRVVPVIALRAMPAPAGTSTLGPWFAAHVSGTSAAAALGTAVLVVAAAALVVGGADWAGAAGGAGARTVAVAGLAGVTIGIGVTGAITRLRGGLDGDGLGAAIELSAVAGLAAGAVLG